MIYGGNYNIGTNSWTTNPEYTEILELNRMLIEAGIPHTLKTLMDGWQICYPSEGTDRVMDAIQHWGSYGNGENLLEIMGLLTPEEEQYDSVVGHLTAKNVFERISKHYNPIKEDPPENIFYAVQQSINGRTGCWPSKFSSKDEAITFANLLNSHCVDVSVQTEVKLYEVKEINF